MHGYGVYIYADGVTYEGQYVLDKKEGFGCYRWMDGRLYEGYWFKGKQHGIGTYTDKEKGSKKFGIWENSKRLKWLNQDAIDLINKQQFDVGAQFTDPENSKKGCVEGWKFSKPEDFDKNMQQIKEVLNI